MGASGDGEGREGRVRAFVLISCVVFVCVNRDRPLFIIMHSALDLRALPHALFDAICCSAVWDEYWFRLARPDRFKIFKHGTAEEKEKLEREMMKHFPFNLVVSFVTTLVTCIGYSAVVAVAKPEGLFEFVLLSWFIPILFVLQADFGASLWQQKPTGLFFISVADQLLSATTMAVVIYFLS